MFTILHTRCYWKINFINDKREWETPKWTKDKNPNVPCYLVQSIIVLKSMTYKRPLIKIPSIEFITIHDRQNY